MQLQIKLDPSARPLIAALNGSRETFRQEMKKELNTLGERGVSMIKTRFRTGGTTATKTAVRSGKLWKAYKHKVRQDRTGLALDVGGLGMRGKVLNYLRVQEGFNAAGQRVNQFIINAKPGGWLTFPIREGGGRGKGSIKRWARVKQVILKPRPALPTVQKFLLPRLQGAGRRAFQRTILGAA